MSVTPAYREFALEQLSRVISVTARSMFRGVGIYSEGLIFALISGDTLYLKVDESNLEDFERAGMGRFSPYGEGGKSMSYYELPGELLEDRAALGPWVEKALQVAKRASSRKGR